MPTLRGYSLAGAPHCSARPELTHALLNPAFALPFHVDTVRTLDHIAHIDCSLAAFHNFDKFILVGPCKVAPMVNTLLLQAHLIRETLKFVSLLIRVFHLIGSVGGGLESELTS